MRQITFTNSRGESVAIGGRPYFLESVTGLGEVDDDKQTQSAPFQDGSTFINAMLAERDLSINLGYEADDKQDMSAARSHLAKIFNPKLGQGTLEYSNGLGRWLIDAVPSVPTFPDDSRVNILQKAQVQLVCPDPFWRSPRIEEEPTFEGLFSFPFTGSFELGVQRDNRIIENDSDAEVPLQVDFHGPAKNPRIDNLTTGEYIRVSQQLKENEVMHIDTTPGQKSVYFMDDNGDERNVFNWIDLQSTFFQLEIGENEIKYRADSDIQGAEVNIYWQKLYVGV